MMRQRITQLGIAAWRFKLNYSPADEAREAGHDACDAASRLLRENAVLNSELQCLVTDLLVLREELRLMVQTSETQRCQHDQGFKVIDNYFACRTCDYRERINEHERLDV